MTPLDDGVLERLLATAVADADPVEVMPPVDGPPGWTEANRATFRAFHRARYGGLQGELRTVMFAVLLDRLVVGMIRMTWRDEPGVMETGMWLGRSARAQGVGVAALRALLAEAARAQARVVVAETTRTNGAAVGALRRCGAVLTDDGAAVRARIPVKPVPDTASPPAVRA